METDGSNSHPNDKATEAQIEVFISHPHRYKELADVLRNTLIEWSNQTINPHQTSDASASPIAVGDAIRPQLEESLRRSSVVLLLYVDADSASYCMYEAGVAVARGEGPLSNTRLIVFQCESEIPAVFKEDLLVTLTNESIRKFTFDFHKNRVFFPLLGRAFAPQLADDFIERRSQKLYNDLTTAWQEVQPEKSLPSVTLPRWISFVVSLDESFANEIEQMANAIEEPTESEPTGLEKAMERAEGLIKQHAVLDRYPSNLLNHFDMSEVPKGRTKLWTLQNRWRNRLIRDGKSQYLCIDWWSEICNQMTLAIAAYSAREIRTPLKSVSEDATWYLPVVTHKTLIPGEKKLEFTICLIRVPANGSDYIRITPPYQS